MNKRYSVKRIRCTGALRNQLCALYYTGWKRNRYDADRRSDDERKRTYRHNGVRQLTATV